MDHPRVTAHVRFEFHRLSHAEVGCLLYCLYSHPLFAPVAYRLGTSYEMRGSTGPTLAVERDTGV